jgi:hypothetical protein
MTAPMVLDGCMTGECFVAYVQQILVPTLRPGDIVILDNLPAHKSAAARDAIEAAGAQMLFLPRCAMPCRASPKRLRQLLLCRRL